MAGFVHQVTGASAVVHIGVDGSPDAEIIEERTVDVQGDVLICLVELGISVVGDIDADGLGNGSGEAGTTCNWLALNCRPWVRSLTQIPRHSTYSPGVTEAAEPMTVMRTRCPRTLIRRTQKPLDSLWNVMRSRGWRGSSGVVTVKGSTYQRVIVLHYRKPSVARTNASVFETS
jgi:hypothetical protein